jgi:hypothetical protein
MVMAYDGSTNGAEWVEVSGHRMAKHGSRDKGRDVWTMGTLKGTGPVHGRIMLKGKIYTFTIPRTGGVVDAINLWGGGGSSSKPTNKPTSKPSGGAGSKDKYGQEHGGDKDGWADTQPGASGDTGGSTSDGTAGSDAATDIGDLPDASATAEASDTDGSTSDGFAGTQGDVGTVQ